jgi:hypothetical protein
MSSVKNKRKRQSIEQLASYKENIASHDEQQLTSNVEISLSDKQQQIYNAIINNNVANLNNLVARYLYTLPSYTKNMTINVRKSIELCSNIDALKRVVDVKIQRTNWPCCSLCGIAIVENMQIEHTIPTTLFRLLFSRMFCVNSTILGKEQFNDIMCGRFVPDDEFSSAIHLTIGVAHDTCNQIKGRDSFIRISVNGGNVQLSPDEEKIRTFANKYYSTFQNGGRAGYMSRSKFISKVNNIFPDISKLYNTVFEKTKAFITQLCIRFNSFEMKTNMLRGNISSLVNSNLKYDSGEIRAVDLFNVNTDDPNFIILKEFGYIREHVHNAATTTKSGRYSKRNSLDSTLYEPNVSYYIYVPKTISIIKNPSEQEREIDDYITSLALKLEINPIYRIGRGVKMNKTQKKKSQNNKQRSKRT